MDAWQESQTGRFTVVGKCIAAAIGILFIHATFRELERTLPRRFGRAAARYKVVKFVVFSGYLSILLFLAILFEFWSSSWAPSRTNNGGWLHLANT
jgi:hypothetical protein